MSSEELEEASLLLGLQKEIIIQSSTDPLQPHSRALRRSSGYNLDHSYAESELVVNKHLEDMEQDVVTSQSHENIHSEDMEHDLVISQIQSKHSKDTEHDISTSQSHQNKHSDDLEHDIVISQNQNKCSEDTEQDILISQSHQSKHSDDSAHGILISQNQNKHSEDTEQDVVTSQNKNDVVSVNTSEEVQCSSKFNQNDVTTFDKTEIVQSTSNPTGFDNEYSEMESKNQETVESYESKSTQKTETYTDRNLFSAMEIISKENTTILYPEKDLNNEKKEKKISTNVQDPVDDISRRDKESDPNIINDELLERLTVDSVSDSQTSNDHEIVHDKLRNPSPKLVSFNNTSEINSTKNLSEVNCKAQTSCDTEAVEDLPHDGPDSTMDHAERNESCVNESIVDVVHSTSEDVAQEEEKQVEICDSNTSEKQTNSTECVEDEDYKQTDNISGDIPCDGKTSNSTNISAAVESSTPQDTSLDSEVQSSRPLNTSLHSEVESSVSQDTSLSSVVESSTPQGIKSSGVIESSSEVESSTTQDTVDVDKSNQNNLIKIQNVASVAFGLDDTLNDSMDEDSDGRLFIDTEGDSMDTEEESNVKERKKIKQFTESPLARQDKSQKGIVVIRLECDTDSENNGSDKKSKKSDTSSVNMLTENDEITLQEQGKENPAAMQQDITSSMEEQVGESSRAVVQENTPVVEEHNRERSTSMPMEIVQTVQEHNEESSTAISKKIVPTLQENNRGNATAMQQEVVQTMQEHNRESTTAVEQEVVPTIQESNVENSTVAQQEIMPTMQDRGSSTAVHQEASPTRSELDRESWDNSTTESDDIGPRITATHTPLGAVIKVEQIDEGYGDVRVDQHADEQGDILDILKKPNKDRTESGNEYHSSKSSGQKKRKHEYAKSSNQPSFEEVSKKIKKEPVDSFSIPKSTTSNQFQGLTTRPGPLVGQRPIQVTSVAQHGQIGTASSSLSHLSRQVDNIPSLHGRQRKVNPGGFIPVSVPFTSNSILRNQLNSSFRFPTGVTRIAVPLVQTHMSGNQMMPQPTQMSGGPMMPQPTQISGGPMMPQPTQMRFMDTRMRPVALSQQQQKASSTTGKTTNNQSIQNITPVTTKSAPSLLSGSLPLKYRIQGTASNKSLTKVSESVTGTVTKTTTTTTNTKSQPVATSSAVESLPTSSINIDTVGMQTITELIARKNPVPNYKAPPIPSELLRENEKQKFHACYECGDSFSMASSYEAHRGRCSMKISYKCDECKIMKIFFNKCQFLSHLRGHLNIEKTQAVPIHIKSDSISIEQLPKSYENVLFQNLSISVKTRVQNNSKRCPECGLVLPVDSYEKHFSGDPNKEIESGDNLYCSACKFSFISRCALRAHRKLHLDVSYNKLEYTCPECGEKGKPEDTDDARWPARNIYLHLRNTCFHLDRVNLINCAKCHVEFQQCKEFKHHYFSKMEQYYKCSRCPMAFRNQEAFLKHYDSQHINSTARPPKSRSEFFKVIFRCHICDSLIDDRHVLESHYNQHAKISKFHYKCRECPKLFDKREELKTHFYDLHSKKMFEKYCKKCDKKFMTWRELMEHDLMHLKQQTEKDVTHLNCNDCGFFYDLDKINRHVCFSMMAVKVPSVRCSNSCSICSKKIEMIPELRDHLKKHQDEGFLICVKCQTGGFSSKEEMFKHESECDSNLVTHKIVIKTKTNLRTKQDLPRKPDKKPNTEKKLPGSLLMECHDCARKFSTKLDLNNHRKEFHGISALFPCHLCGLTYESNQSLRKHLRVTHEGKTHVYPCVVCRKKGIRKIFTNSLVLEKHLATKHRVAKNQISSSIVNEFANDNDIINPPPKVIPKNVHEQPMEITEADSPVKRLHVVGSDQVLNCAKCKFVCEDRTKFLEHLKLHKIDNAVQCLECGLCFAIIPSLRKHLFMVHKVKDFEEYCEKNGIDIKTEVKEIEFEDNVDSSTTEDVEEETDDESRNPLECRVCYRMFENETKLRSHMRSHGMAFIRNKRREKAAQMSSHSLSANSKNENNEKSNTGEV